MLVRKKINHEKKKYININSQVKISHTYSTPRNNNVTQNLKFYLKIFITKIMLLKELGNHANSKQSKNMV